MSIRYVVTMATVLLSAGAANAGYTSNHYDREYCREFTQRIYVGGVRREGYGVSCLQPDGAWRIVAEPSIHRPLWRSSSYRYKQPYAYYPTRTFYQPTSYFSIRIGDDDRHHYKHPGKGHGHGYNHGKSHGHSKHKGHHGGHH